MKLRQPLKSDYEPIELLQLPDDPLPVGFAASAVLSGVDRGAQSWEGSAHGR